LERLKANHDVTVSWRSFELRPPGSPPIPPEYRQRIEQMRPQLEQVARERYGLTLNAGPFGLNSRPALIGAKFAEAQGVGEAYHDGVFRAYWQAARDIGATAVLTEIAVSIGLDAAAFVAALADPRWLTAVTDDVDLAHRMGLNGVPAMLFAGKYLVSGAQPYAALVRVLAQVEDEMGQRPTTNDE
jgi:predicted DsbA family dithiol-disulfide isomerase